MIFYCFLIFFIVKLFTEINNQSTMKGCIVLIIGLPASGKTTFTTKLVNYINSNHVDLKPLYLNFDKVIPLESQLFLVNQLDSSWKESRRHFVSSCQAFLYLLLNSPKCVSSSRSVLIDDDDDTKYLGEIINQLSVENVDHFDYFAFIVEDNFYYKSMREPFFRLSRQFKLGLLLITINTPLDSCLKRNEKRSNSVDEKVINRMADHFERPVKDEFGVGVGETIQLMEINSDDGESKLEDDLYEKVVTAIRKACDIPIKSKFKGGSNGDNDDDDDDHNQQETREVSRKVTADNLVHRFDKLLRLCVNRMMMDPPSMGVNCNIGKELSIIRKRLLKRFANNQLDAGLGEALIKEETPTNQRLINLIQSELEERKGKH